MPPWEEEAALPPWKRRTAASSAADDGARADMAEAVAVFSQRALEGSGSLMLPRLAAHPRFLSLAGAEIVNFTRAAGFAGSRILQGREEQDQEEG